ncbi:ATP-binding protein [Dysgonomonas capnocytophagoides]|uniref:ATP-binding protein n=1 Tax=Dysgonomonas capnocytophagoides TaxID=45254 RepID=UPI00333EA41D
MQFRTKARAVDLLGRGQIADLPTAITELWKNGYDAYADNLTAEIFKTGYLGLESPLFLMTDDGKGMSQKDILEKWLVLGTDSKTRAELENTKDVETLWKDPRVKAGEKGIGRLSVAFLGSPMLMLSKKIGSPIQLLFFDWRLLENFNYYLDDINIPVLSLDKPEDFPNIFSNLKKEFLKNFEKKNDSDGNPIWEEKQLELKQNILNSVENISIATQLIPILTKNIENIVNDHGTKFLIFEPIDQILELADENKNEEDKESRDFVISSLSGFFNPFVEKENRIPVETHIYVHEEIGKDKDLLNLEGNFFTNDDFHFADILINGQFDGNGSFTGKLKIYDEEIDYTYDTNRRKFKKKFYGEVQIKLGYSQGDLRDSKLTELAWKKINDKVDRNGGLYIYRDNFRVLPYGRSNFDFLKFEERRSKRIGTYFFSYRRMFGYLGLERSKNQELKDKSSREGLINNEPYRAFESDLTSFFIQLAKDYFSDKAKDNLFLDKKKKLNDQDTALKEDKKRETEEKKAFTRSLKEYPNKFKNYENKYSSLLVQLDEKLKIAATTYDDIENILRQLKKLEVEYDHLLPQIPKRYKPTETQLDRLNDYEEQILAFNTNVKNREIILMQKVREKLEIRDLKREFVKNALVYKNELERLIGDNRFNLRTKFDELLNDYDGRAEQILTRFSTYEQSALNQILNKEDVEIESIKLKALFDELKQITDESLISLSSHISRMSFDIDEEILQGAYKERYEQMKYQWSRVQDTAQLGVAVEIIDHEFNVLYSRINRLLSDLDNTVEIHQNDDFRLLERTFRSLEEKYDLLSPLYRINGAIAKDVKCEDIVSYIKNFFGKKIEEENIRISATSDFLEHIISIKEPTLYTVIINIVNNAIYWLRNVDDKSIKFDYRSHTNEILIQNSGRKIEEHRLSKIFDLFYSNRPNGRGIGLYLAKQSLNESGFDIYATNESEYNSLKGACFVIKNLHL